LNFAIKLDLKLDEEGQRIIDGQSKILNWTYNQLLDRANSLREEFKKTGNETACKTLYTQRGLRNLLPDLKKEFPFLKSVHSSPLKNSALRLSDSIRAYQDSRKGKRKGKKTGWPSFKSFRRNFFSLLYDEPNKGFKVSGGEIILSLGVDEKGKRLKVSGKLSKKVSDFKNVTLKNLRITKEGKRYFAVFSVEKNNPAQKEIKKICAIDPNHKNLGYVVGSDGSSVEIANAYFLKTLEKRIDQIKSRRDKCLKKSKKVELPNGKTIYIASKRRIKFESIFQKLHQKRRDQTKTFLHTITNKLYREYDLVGIGDYTPTGTGLSKGMRRSMNNESLIGRFKETLSWTARKKGKFFEIWDEKGSTRTCSKCAYVHKEGIDPQIRIWICPGCQTTHLRDENAAKNGLKKIKLPCLGLLVEEIHTRSAWRFNGSGILETKVPGPVDVGGDKLAVQGHQEIKPVALQPLIQSEMA